MILPHRALHHPARAARIAANAPRRFAFEHRIPVLVLQTHHEVVAGDAGVVHENVDASRTRLSTSATSCATAAVSLTSHAKPCAPPPIAAAPPRRPSPCRVQRPRRAHRIRAAPAAIARPIPRVLPVTSATLADEIDLHSRHHARAVSRLPPECRTRRSAGSGHNSRTAVQSTRLPGPISTKIASRKCAAMFVISPAHRTGDVSCDASSSRASAELRDSLLRSRWKKPGNAGSANGVVASASAKTVDSRLHQRRMKRAAHRETDCALRTGFLCKHHQPLDSG